MMKRDRNNSEKRQKAGALKPGMLPELNALFEEKKAPKNRKKTEKTGKKPKKPEKMGKKRQEAGTLIYKYLALHLLYYIYIIILFIAILNLLIIHSRLSCTISSSILIFFELFLSYLLN
jgi:hypothetical protein